MIGVQGATGDTGVPGVQGVPGATGVVRTGVSEMTSSSFRHLLAPKLQYKTALIISPRPTHQRPVYQSPYCCKMVRYCAVLICP